MRLIIVTLFLYIGLLVLAFKSSKDYAIYKITNIEPKVTSNYPFCYLIIAIFLLSALYMKYIKNPIGIDMFYINLNLILYLFLFLIFILINKFAWKLFIKKKNE